MVEFWTDHFSILLRQGPAAQGPRRSQRDPRECARASSPTCCARRRRARRCCCTSTRTAAASRRRTRTTPARSWSCTRSAWTAATRRTTWRSCRASSPDGRTTPAFVFTFNRGFHDFTAKTFLGTSFPAMPSTASGSAEQSEGEAAITMLLNHPSTARYIATKMARVAAGVRSAAGGDRCHGRHVHRDGRRHQGDDPHDPDGQEPHAAPAKYKRPFHLAASSLRGVGAEVLNVRTVRQRLDGMDMPPFYWEQPDGYPDRDRLVERTGDSRWNWATYISGRPDTDANVRVDTVNKFRAPQEHCRRRGGTDQHAPVRRRDARVAADARCCSYLAGGHVQRRARARNDRAGRQQPSVPVVLSSRSTRPSRTRRPRSLRILRHDMMKHSAPAVSEYHALARRDFLMPRRGLRHRGAACRRGCRMSCWRSRRPAATSSCRSS